MSDLGYETHVQHAIRLIQYQDINQPKIEVVVAHEIQQSPRGSHQDVHRPGFQRPILFLIVFATHQGNSVQVTAVSQLYRIAGNLYSELTCWSHNQSPRFRQVTLAFNGIAQQIVNDRDKECGSLARSGLCATGYVMTFEGIEQALRLNWSAMLEPKLANSLTQRRLKSKAVGGGWGFCAAGIHELLRVNDWGVNA